ncbi:nicotinate-nucleotide adenylyltransferase [Brevibacillus humidisoli]|uniref:nicotinate-nucleotide adenylyltransferase n=1 Tax=Brevibacillus humidisoli TaxID=2895522 RepID=UPI001E3D58A2|nr:nicotinate-nucleotide adenylyltransferase [Brevibacillus humidisoli]UFJ38896.1 nicotinate-nucleotide adenylyltransferase [Brevibacillus humidisoli]
MRQRQIGIMGGTFDPIHCGHLLAAEQAREQAALDEIWFLPTHIPPHKPGEEITAAHHRLRMVELATADHPAFQVNRIELDRSGPSYTVDTMRQLTREYPDTRFSFIIGGDMVSILPQWHRFSELVQLVRFIGLHRPGSTYDRQSLASYVTFVEMPLWDVSSTMIRNKVKAGSTIRYLVPEAVERYIKENRLYGATL